MDVERTAVHAAILISPLLFASLMQQETRTCKSEYGCTLNNLIDKEIIKASIALIRLDSIIGIKLSRIDLKRIFVMKLQK